MELINKLHKLVKNKPDNWRQGQAYFNYLYNINPKLANEIRGTKNDPFYSNDNLDKFFNYILLKNN